MGKKKPVISFNSTSITEGDSLITTLTNLKPKKKFFYALSGDGVDKSDLDSGKVKGRLKASKQGTAVISHLFSEDNFYEGTETFTLSIFKDKKNRKLLSESQSLVINDSNNSEPSKTSKSNFFGLSNGIKLQVDTVYDQIDSPQGKEFLGNLPGKNRKFAPNPSHVFEVEGSESNIVFTKETIGEKTVDGIPQSSEKYWQRIAFSGEFEYDKNGEYQGGTLDSVTSWTHGQTWDSEDTYEWINIDQHHTGIPIGNTANALWLATMQMMDNERIFDYLGDYGENGYTQGDSKESFYIHPSAKYFEDNWWENPFAPDLI